LFKIKTSNAKNIENRFLYLLTDRMINMSQGMLDLRVWPNQEADGNFPSSTPGKARDHGKEQMQRLAKVWFPCISLLLVRLLQ
jgi:hypothetical protein